MTLVAGYLQVFRVTETDAKRRHEFRCARIATQLMTCAARRNITAAGLRSRSMTSITSCVCIEPGRNGHRDTRARRSMTTCATNAAHGDVSRMIEFHAKALQMRKRFERPWFHVGMTNSTNRTFGIWELLRVTTGARQVARRARTPRYRRVGIAPVTEQARQAGMIATAVLKLSIVQSFGKLHLFLRGLGINQRARGARINCGYAANNDRDKESRQSRRDEIFIAIRNHMYPRPPQERHINYPRD